MKLRKKILFALGLSICLLAGCSDKNPVDGGTVTPTEKPTVTATATPTEVPTVTATPTEVPTVTATPTVTPTVTATPTATPTVTPTPTEDPDLLFVKSYLTGHEIRAKYYYGRPVAVMFNNLKASCPQSAIGRASFVYEAPVRGGVTQLMCVFENSRSLFEQTEIGSVGSGYTQFVDYAASLDAIYVHNGGADDIASALEIAQVDALDAVSDVSKDSFYVKDDTQAPNHLYTDGAGLEQALELGKYRMAYKEDYVPWCTFFNGYLKNATPAHRVYPGYSYNAPCFEYDTKSQVYYRYQFEDKQVDELDKLSLGETRLGYDNIILEYTSWSYVDEESGTLKLDTHTKNKGKYITNGAMIDITWERDENGTVQYKDMDGNPLVIRSGKTWVCVILDTEADKVKIEASR